MVRGGIRISVEGEHRIKGWGGGWVSGGGWGRTFGEGLRRGVGGPGRREGWEKGQ